jgi:hypothetical protein
MSIVSDDKDFFKPIIPKFKKLYESAIYDFEKGQVLSVQDLVRHFFQIVILSIHLSRFLSSSLKTNSYVKRARGVVFYKL